MVNFPVSLDTLTNPTSSSSTLGHADLHSKVNDIVEALMAKVGIDNSNDASSIDYLLKNPLSVSPGHKHAIGDINLINETFVHKTGNDTIAGTKTFSDAMVIIYGRGIQTEFGGTARPSLKTEWAVPNTGGGDSTRITPAGTGITDNMLYSGAVRNGSHGDFYINGNLTVTGGSPGLGKVLTSDASGNATWTLPGSSQVTYTVAYSALPTSFSVAHGLGYAPKKIKMKILSSKVNNPTSEGTYNNGVYNEIHQVFTVANPPQNGGYAFATDKIAFMDYQNSATNDDINYTMTVSSIDNVNVNFAVTKTIGAAAAGALYAIIDFN